MQVLKEKWLPFISYLMNDVEMPHKKRQDAKRVKKIKNILSVKYSCSYFFSVETSYLEKLCLSVPHTSLDSVPYPMIVTFCNALLVSKKN